MLSSARLSLPLSCSARNAVRAHAVRSSDRLERRHGLRLELRVVLEGGDYLEGRILEARLAHTKGEKT